VGVGDRPNRFILVKRPVSRLGGLLGRSGREWKIDCYVDWIRK